MHVFAAVTSTWRLVWSRAGSGFGMAMPRMLPGEYFVGVEPAAVFAYITPRGLVLIYPDTSKWTIRPLS